MAPTPSPKSTFSTPKGSSALMRFTRRKSLTPSSLFQQQPTSNSSPAPTSSEHPIEVVGRIREHPDKEKERERGSVIHVLPNGSTIRVRTELGYRDFSLDGVSVAENEDLGSFYRRFVEPRVSGVRTGGKCTVMMYGPTGCGKSHTMFGRSVEPGIIYRALHDILGEQPGPDVRVSVLEIYNEDVYDLLSANISSPGPNAKNTGCRVRLEVMGKKVKNAMYITGNEAGKIANEVAKVEKRRVVKSTAYNDRSSRSHCIIMLDVPSVGGRLMLVDMAGSEQIDQASSYGIEAKMQTAKINQGNVALRRVVEAIANGDHHIPFRDSKLTMLLQDSFEEDGAKILMVLCANPDARDIHKTIGTLEYGAKAKCIVRCTDSSSKERSNNAYDFDSTVLGARIVAMDEYILKLQRDNKLKDKEMEAAQRELQEKEKEVALLKSKLNEMLEKQSVAEVEIESKVEERARALKEELMKKFDECQRSADMFVELGKRKMEKKILEQQEEAEILRKRLEEIESELCYLKGNAQEPYKNTESDGNSDITETGELVRSSAKILQGMQAWVQQMKDIHTSQYEDAPSSLADSEDVRSQDLHNRRDCTLICSEDDNLTSVDDSYFQEYPADNNVRFSFVRPDSDIDEEEELEEMDIDSGRAMLRLSTVYEEDEDVNEEEAAADDSLDKCVVSEVTTVTNYSPTGSTMNNKSRAEEHVEVENWTSKLTLEKDVKEFNKAKTPERDVQEFYKAKAPEKSVKVFDKSKTPEKSVKVFDKVTSMEKEVEFDKVTSFKDIKPKLEGTVSETMDKDPSVSRKARIQNIFMLCGNYREVAKKARTAFADKSSDDLEHKDQVKHSQDVADLGYHLPILPRSRSCKASFSFEESPTKLSAESVGLEKSDPKALATEDSGSKNTDSLLQRLKHHSPISGFGYQACEEDKTEQNEEVASKGEDHLEKCLVYVKWETSKEASGKLIRLLQAPKSSSLRELRKMIEPYLGDSKPDFIFLLLGDPSGRPVSKDKEADINVNSLPDCHNRKGSRLACLRVPARRHDVQPFNPIENQLQSLNSHSPQQLKQLQKPLSPEIIHTNVTTATVGSNILRGFRT